MAASGRHFCLILILVLTAPGMGRLGASPARADTSRVATATNFADVVAELKPVFETHTGHTIITVTGSTGKLYAQIRNGAPYHAFLAADRGRPELLENEGAAVAGSRFTYAIGRLTLWSRETAIVAADGRERLTSDTVRHIAIANPELAPYGLAARETFQSMGLWNDLAGKIVMGENIGQAFSMVATGNAEIGLVALSAVVQLSDINAGSRWDVPAGAHSAIRQDAVLLRLGEGNEAAIAFLEFLRSDEARAVIVRFGYDVE